MSADVREQSSSALPMTELSSAPQPGALRLGRAKRLPKRRGGRVSRRGAAEIVRYFVGRPADGDAKPTLEQEVASEPEALIIAFKNDSRVYLVYEYRVTQQIEGDQVRLVKEPAASDKRVSTTNES